MRDLFYATTFICHLSEPIYISKQAYFDNAKSYYERSLIKESLFEYDKSSKYDNSYFFNKHFSENVFKLLDDLVEVEKDNYICKKLTNIKSEIDDNLSEGIVCLFYNYDLTTESVSAYNKYQKSKRKNSFEIFWNSEDGVRYNLEISHGRKEFRNLKNYLDLIFSTIENEHEYKIYNHSRFLNLMFPIERSKIDVELKSKLNNMYFESKCIVDDKLVKKIRSIYFLPDIIEKVLERYNILNSRQFSNEIRMLSEIYSVFLTTDNLQIKILELASMLEYITTIKPENCKIDSICKQFSRKTSYLLAKHYSIEHNEIQLELKHVYNYRFSIAHGDYREINKIRSNISDLLKIKKEGINRNVDSFINAIDTIIIGRLKQIVMLIFIIYLYNPSEVKKVKNVKRFDEFLDKICQF